MKLAWGLAPLGLAGLVAASCIADEYAGGCPPQTKACGLRCVSFDDPATGCAEASCDPCPAGGDHATAVCTVGRCDTTCEAGWDSCVDTASASCDTDITRSKLNCGGCTKSCLDSKDVMDASCSGGKCVSLVCKDGKGDCNGNVDDGCEQDLLGDPKHCGSCKQDCFGTTCMNGKCLPETVVENANAVAVVLDGNDLYWSSNTQVRRIDKKLTNKTAMQTTLVATGQAAPADIAFFDKYVVWTTIGATHGIWFLDKSAPLGPPQQLMTMPQSGPAGLAFDPNYLYWSNLGVPGMIDPSITRVAFTSPNVGMSIYSKPGSSPADLITFGDDLFFSDLNQSLIVRAKTTSIPLADAAFVHSAKAVFLAIDPAGKYLYWTDPATQMIHRTPLAGPGAGTEITDVVTSSAVWGVAVDDQFVYFASGLLQTNGIIKIAVPAD